MSDNLVRLCRVNQGNEPTRELRLDQTQEVPTEALQLGQAKPEFRPGVAPIPAEQPSEPTLSFEPTLPPGAIVTSGDLKKPKLPLRDRLRLLRSGGRWSVAGAVFLLVCWGLSATGGGDFTSASLALVLVLAVSIGLFGLLRLVGGMVLEKMMGRTRRSAILSHVVIGVFLIAAGFSYLATIDWVVGAWNFLRGVR